MIKPFPIKPSTDKERMIKVGKTTIQLPPSTWKSGKVKCGYRVCVVGENKFIIRFMSGIHWCFPAEIYFYPNEEKKKDRLSLVFGSGGHNEGVSDLLQIAEVQAAIFTKVAEVIALLQRAV
jgi:hypothetical protein